MGILEKISEIEKEIARTQKNKATEYHLGLLKAKLAKYRSQLLEPSKKSEKGEGFDVLKSGDARVALIGFPSVGKSTLLSTLTHTESEAASYEFTTLTCIPGVIEYRGANIQLLDLPGIIEGAAQGKGRGRQMTVPFKVLLEDTGEEITFILYLDDPEKSAKDHAFLRMLLTNELERRSNNANIGSPQQSDTAASPPLLKKAKIALLLFGKTGWARPRSTASEVVPSPSTSQDDANEPPVKKVKAYILLDKFVQQ